MWAPIPGIQNPNTLINVGLCGFLVVKAFSTPKHGTHQKLAFRACEIVKADVPKPVFERLEAVVFWKYLKGLICLDSVEIMPETLAEG